MKYKFRIINDSLSEEEHFDGVSGNKNVYLCEFDITCDEDGAVWFAVFKKGDENYISPITNGTCAFPYECLEESGAVYVGCYAECSGNKRISTNWLPLNVQKGAYSAGTAPTPPEADVWETLLANSVPVIGENGNWYTYDMAEEMYVDTGFASRGEKGEKGDRGDTGAAGYTPQKGVDYFTASDIAEFSENFAQKDTKQDTLVSGENIKTVNGESILGSGNLVTGHWKLLGEKVIAANSASIRVNIGESYFFTNTKYTKFKLSFDVIPNSDFTATAVPLRVYFLDYAGLGYRLLQNTSNILKRSGSDAHFTGELVSYRNSVNQNTFCTILLNASSTTASSYPYIAQNNGSFENNVTARSIKNIQFDCFAQSGLTFLAGSTLKFYAWEE